MEILESEMQGLWSNQDHLMQYLKEDYKKGEEWIKTIKKINNCLMNPSKFGKKCAARMTNQMKCVLNKIRATIERFGEFFKKN
ncbi:unnamed protein product [Paramecium sonneborni]|uniref:Uncharacterized protein n=1 Tax=Paramecium sonneborni TaxID=65129 RepID=A0A8S1MEM4_9CILI|nr:unnamed protein product [Paramecium sonneborni]